jgi:hypothetical protein
MSAVGEVRQPMMLVGLVSARRYVSFPSECLRPNQFRNAGCLFRQSARDADASAAAGSKINDREPQQ